MAEDYDPQLAEIVRAFIARQLSIPAKKLNDDASLFHDLGVDGQDGVEFLDAYAREFHVDKQRLTIDDFFGEEASGSPLGLLARVFKSPPGKKRLTVRDLVIGAKNKSLDHLRG